MGQNENEHFSTSDQLRKYFSHKWLFIASFAICLLACFVVVKMTMPLYGIYASIVIKDERKGEPGDFPFKDIEVFDDQYTVDNESEIIRSKTIVSAVVKKMALNINYFSSDPFFVKTALNYKSPIVLTTKKETEDLYEIPLKIRVIDTSTYQLLNTNKIYQYGELVNIPEGQFVINKTKQFGLAENNVVEITIESIDEAAQSLRSNISVAQTSKNASMLNLALLHPVPEQGVDILNAIIEEYNSSNNKYRQSQTVVAVNIIQERLDLLAGQLDHIENSQQRYKSTMGITELSADAQLFLDKAKESDNKITEAEIKLEVLRSIEDYAKLEGSPMPPTTGLNDPVLLSMLTKISDLELSKSELVNNLGPENINVKTKASQINEIRKNIIDNIRVQKQNIQSALGQLTKNKRQIDSEIKSVPVNERNLTKIVREKNIHENIYNYLLQKREEANISAASEYSKLRIVDSSYSSVKPVKPNKLIILFTGLLFALLIPVIIINIRRAANNKVHFPVTPDMVKAEILGEINLDKKTHRSPFLSNGHSFVSEQFRMLIARLKRDEPHCKLILVTSSMPGEGKSYVSTHLTEALAGWGSRVILVDADLRKGKLTGDLQLEEGVLGLSDYLTGAGDNINDIIYKFNGVGNSVDVISSGTKDQNSFTSLSDKKLDALLVYLRNNYEFIIINTPPVGLMSDAIVLSRNADITLYIIRNDFTLNKNLKLIADLNTKKVLGKMYVVLNGSDEDSKQYRKQYRQYLGA